MTACQTCLTCLICEQPFDRSGWVLCGTNHCANCVRHCRFCMAELRDES